MIRVLYEVVSINKDGELLYRDFFRNKKLAAKAIKLHGGEMRKLNKNEMKHMGL